MRILLGQHRFALAILHWKGQETAKQEKKKRKKKMRGEKIALSLHIPDLLHTYYLIHLLTQPLSSMYLFS